MSLTYGSMSFDDTVTIVVGPEKRKFIVPKNFLCRSSPFFRAALSGNWSETSPGGCLEMPEEDGDTFTAYLQWTFSGEVVVYEYEADLSNLNNHCPKLFDLYVFADKVGDGTAEYYHGPSSPYQRTICHATFGTYDSESDEPTAGELHAHEMAS